MPNTPSFYAHLIQGLLILAAVILVFKNLNLIKGFDIYRKLILILLFALVFGAHSLSHLSLEAVYNYNPLSEI